MPEYINKFLEENKKSVHILTKEHFKDKEEFSSEDLRFTGNVYLYTDKIEVPEELVRKHFTENGFKLILRDEDYWKQYQERNKPDAFISYDSRDKEFAKGLYDALAKRQLIIWFDQCSLKVGDKLTEKLEDGLQSCNYGILIVSKNFLGNEKWAKMEFNSLKFKEIITKKKTILPIRLGVSVEEVAKYSLSLANTISIDGTQDVNKIADSLVSTIKYSRNNEQDIQI